MGKEIRIFKLTFDKEFREKFYKGCQQIFDEAFLANHTFVREFESSFAKASESRYSLGVTSGTTAIEAALRALNVQGKEVILGTNTFIATAVAIQNAGGIPIAVDIEDQYYSLSPEKLKASITKRTGAVIIIHIAGLVSPRIKEIQNICREYNLPLVEDCAQAYGSEYNGTKVGNFGIAGCFSFQTTKVMTTGEGGMVITNDEKYYDVLRSVRQFGMDLNNSISHVRNGSNFKMSEFVALAGLCELDRVDVRMSKRQMLAERYQKNLDGSGWKTLKSCDGGKTGYYKQIVLPPVEREVVAEHFKRNNIMLTGGVYYIPIHRQPIYSGNYDDAQFPVANYFADHHICPPCYPELELDDIDYITDVMLKLHN